METERTMAETPAATTITENRASTRSPRSSFSRKVLVLYLPVLLLSVPFFGHQSRDPVFLGYSRDYLLFLGVMVAGGFGLCCALLAFFHRAPADRQLPFAFICIGLLGGVLLIAELWLGWRDGDAFKRYREWGHIRSPFYGFEAAASHSWSQAGADYTTDENTFRKHMPPRVAPDEEIRIFALGGSSVFGYGLHDDQTWPHLLEERLRRRLGPRITVINAGINGHNTLQQLFRLYLRVLPEHPHYVLHYGLINDIESEKTTLAINMPAALVQVSSLREYLRLENAGKGFYQENSLLASHLIHIAQRLVDRTPAPASEPPGGGEKQGDTGASRYIENIRTMELLCRERGIRFIPMTFLADLSKFPEQTAGRVRTYLQALRAFCQQSNIELVDLYGGLQPAMEGEALFFEDRYHPRAAGARYIAEHMAEILIPLLEDRLNPELVALGANAGQ
ncbi:MAG: hypothetical protein AMXMBFR13_04670 [Phycisphaerae bacterium]